MSVSNVSTLDSDIWTLIQTNTITSGTTASSFTGISGYKKLAFTWNILTSSGNNYPMLTFNSDNTNGNYSNWINLYDANVIGGSNRLWLSGSNRQDHSGYLEIIDVDQSSPKYVTKFSCNYGMNFNGAYLSSSAITSAVLAPNTATWDSGTIRMYGIAR